jgi:hypothetical protein
MSVYGAIIPKIVGKKMLDTECWIRGYWILDGLDTG